MDNSQCRMETVALAGNQLLARALPLSPKVEAAGDNFNSGQSGAPAR